ncbi:hypothetical protein [Halalkalibacter alkaliphilus]|uniref:Uncharacterized protein n=1 Tax=Halalkalibacter alkaliphilus TaxID=2917993 RepID=A0A9X2I906_9BACI|nr:hypothetical protein [Halalkalibacter alkaliphilus]MCL7748480.1 hypothetical protein [Halalkalibacter alkaliphilus]
MRTTHENEFTPELPTPYTVVPPAYVKTFTEYLRMMDIIVRIILKRIISLKLLFRHGTVDPLFIPINDRFPGVEVINGGHFHVPLCFIVRH